MARKHRRPLSVLELERRDVPAYFGNPWPDAQHLTLSFAPDGTGTYGAASSLSTTLPQAAGATNAGQLAVLRAFQTWASVANVNIGLVGDSGAAFGTAGPAQGSTTVGDIRVASRPLGTNELAVTTPFDLLGAGSGDIMLNSGYAFTVSGAAGAYDLYTVTLQEAGHSLGLPNSPDTGSVMYTVYGTPRTGLAASDVTAIQSLYGGARLPDQFDAVQGNGTLATAKKIKFFAAVPTSSTDLTGGSDPTVAVGDITTAGDVDVYKVDVPDKVTSLPVAVRTSGYSLAQLKVTVLNAAGTVLQTASAADPRAGDLLLTAAVTKGTYYVRVEAAAGAGVFGVGGYRVAAGTAAQTSLYSAAALAAMSISATESTDRTTLTGGSRWGMIQRAAINTPTDTDPFKFRIAAGSPPVLVATVWATDGSAVDPTLRVTTDKGVTVPCQVLANDSRYYTIQATGLTQDKDYYIEVSNGGTGTVGGYFLASDVRTETTSLGGYTATLTQANREQAYQLDVTKDRLYRFTLTGGQAANVVAAVRLTVYDANQHAIGTVVAQEGQTVALDVYLPAGTYRYKVSGAAQAGPLPAFAYTLSAQTRNDPIGPKAVDVIDTIVGADTDVADDDVFATYLPWLIWTDVYSDPWAVGL